MKEQQDKADIFIKSNIKKNAEKGQEGRYETVPDEIKKFRGFTAIPPFLRVFPSKLSLQNLTKRNYVEREEKSQLLSIKNKRDLEDKLVAVSQPNQEQNEDEVPSTLLQIPLGGKHDLTYFH